MGYRQAFRATQLQFKMTHVPALRGAGLANFRHAALVAGVWCASRRTAPRAAAYPSGLWRYPRAGSMVSSPRGSLRSRPRFASAWAASLCALRAPPSQARLTSRFAGSASPASGSARPPRRTPKPRILPRGAHGQGRAAPIPSPVRCSPAAVLRVRPRGSPLTPRCFPVPGARYGERLRGTMELTSPNLVSPAGTARSGSRSRGPMCTTQAQPEVSQELTCWKLQPT